MVLPEAETQRPSTLSFPAFANQFEELERVQTQHRAAAYFNDYHAPFFHAASPNNRGPLTTRNIDPGPRDLPLPPLPILQTRVDEASSTPQAPTPETRRPNQLPTSTPYPGEVSLRPPQPPHLRIRSPDVSNPDQNPAPTPRTPYPHSQGPSPRPNRPYLPSRPAPPTPPLPPSSSASPRTPLSPRPITHPPPPPHGHLISIYALSVRPGDILAYGNKLNHGCTVTACYPDERRPDLVPSDEGEVGGPVKINGGIRIRWRDGETGEMLSQLFEGLEVLEVRRGEEEGEGEEG